MVSLLLMTFKKDLDIQSFYFEMRDEGAILVYIYTLLFVINNNAVRPAICVS